MSSVYAVFYSVNEENKSFLIFTKRVKGYFYHKGRNGPQVYQDGHQVPQRKGPGLHALPGGTMENEDSNNVVKGAQREFREECGASISFIEGLFKNGEQSYNIIDTQTAHFNDGSYDAVYFKFSSSDLLEIQTIIQDTNFSEASDVINDITSLRITLYNEIPIQYPFCPLDNELENVEMWNFQQNEVQINQLASSIATDWYYHILMHLHDRIN